MGIFARVAVETKANKDKIIYWEIHNNTIFQNIPDFYVDFGRSSEDWVQLNTTALNNVVSYTDTIQRRYSVKSDFYYRVRVVDGTTTYTSDPVAANGFLTGRDYLIVKNILRQEYLRMRKTPAGVQGYLLKIKEYGTPCTACVDFNTGNVVDVDCTICYGTRFEGGYYPQTYPIYLDFQPTETINEDVSTPLGAKDTRLQTAGCVAFPLIKSHDIFVEKYSNKRYIIQQIKVKTEYRGVPLFYLIGMEEVPASRIEFNIPIIEI